MASCKNIAKIKASPSTLVSTRSSCTVLQTWSCWLVKFALISSFYSTGLHPAGVDSHVQSHLRPKCPPKLCDETFLFFLSM